MLAGVTVSGVLMALFMANAGGAWDNAKKSFEGGGYNRRSAPEGQRGPQRGRRRRHRRRPLQGHRGSVAQHPRQADERRGAGSRATARLWRHLACLSCRERRPRGRFASRGFSLRASRGLGSRRWSIPRRTAAWKALRAHHAEVDCPRDASTCFGEDPGRASRFSLMLGDLLFDFSKNRVTEETLSLLAELCEECGVRDWTARMFAGEAINETEGRAVLHTALRNRGERAVTVGGADVMPDVRRVLARMRTFTISPCEKAAWVGHSGPRDHGRRQHRDRWLRSRSGDGHRGAAPLLEARATRALRLERGQQPPERGAPPGAARNHAFHRGFEDLHHPGDPHQRPVRAPMARRPAGQ